MFERALTLWKQYLTLEAGFWDASDPRHSLSAEVRRRLAELDICLGYLNRALEATGRVAPIPQALPPYLRAWDETHLFTEVFYLIAWRVINVTEASFGFPRSLRTIGAARVRHDLIEHPKTLKAHEPSLVITDAGPILRTNVAAIKPDGKSGPTAESLDRGLFVNAEELRDRLEQHLKSVL